MKVLLIGRDRHVLTSVEAVLKGSLDSLNVVPPDLLDVVIWHLGSKSPGPPFQLGDLKPLPDVVLCDIHLSFVSAQNDVTAFKRHGVPVAVYSELAKDRAAVEAWPTPPDLFIHLQTWPASSVARALIELASQKGQSGPAVAPRCSIPGCAYHGLEWGPKCGRNTGRFHRCPCKCHGEGDETTRGAWPASGESLPDLKLNKEAGEYTHGLGIYQVQTLPGTINVRRWQANQGTLNLGKWISPNPERAREQIGNGHAHWVTVETGFSSVDKAKAYIEEVIADLVEGPEEVAE